MEFSGYILPVAKLPGQCGPIRLGLRDVLPPRSVLVFLGCRLSTNLTETHFSRVLLSCLSFPRQRMEARHEACALSIFSLPPLSTPSGLSYLPLAADQLFGIMWFREARFQRLQRGLGGLTEVE